MTKKKSGASTMADGFKGKEAADAEGKQKGSNEPSLEEKNADLVNQLQRLQAEFENFKRRTDEEAKRTIQYAKKDLIKGLLPLLDSFELALAHKEKTDECIKGVEMIQKNFVKLLEDEGLRPIDCDGKKFDPYMHEVLLTEESDQEEDTILQELQKGYLLKDLVLRHSKVKIAKSKND